MSEDIDIGKISEALNDKTDRDFNNMNPSGLSKETVVDWGMPDYGAGISKSKGIIYQAECDGFVWVYGVQNNIDHASLALKIGFQSDLSDFKDIGKFYVSPSTHLESSCFIPIPKGMYYEGTDSNGRFEMIFYPAKGTI